MLNVSSGVAVSMVVRDAGNDVLWVERFEETEPPDPRSPTDSIPLPPNLSDLAAVAWLRLGQTFVGGVWMGEVDVDASGALTVRAWLAPATPMHFLRRLLDVAPIPWRERPMASSLKPRLIAAITFGSAYYGLSWSLVL